MNQNQSIKQLAMLTVSAGKDIDLEAEKLDISKFPSKAAELHRLFDDASESIFALLVFARKAGVILDFDNYLPVAATAMQRDQAGKRTVSTWWNGRLERVDVDSLDSASATRLALAEHYGVPEQAMLRFERRITDQSGGYLHVSCNQRGCSMSKIVGFSTPAEMLDAEHRAANEIWYCHHHRQEAFEQEGALSDELLPVLERIAESPGLTQTATGAPRVDIQFLEVVGLVSVDRAMHGRRFIGYKIALTDTGRGHFRVLTSQGTNNRR